MAGMMTNVAHPPQVPPSLAGVSSLLAAWSGMCTGGAMTLTHGMLRRGDLSLAPTGSEGYFLPTCSSKSHTLVSIAGVVCVCFSFCSPFPILHVFFLGYVLVEWSQVA